jgi:hypothetical protein
MASAAAPPPPPPPIQALRTRLQQGIRKPKKYTDGTIRYGMFTSIGEPSKVSKALEHLHRRPQNTSQNTAGVDFGLGAQIGAPLASPKICQRPLDPKKIASAPALAPAWQDPIGSADSLGPAWQAKSIPKNLSSPCLPPFRAAAGDDAPLSRSPPPPPAKKALWPSNASPLPSG